MIQPQCVFCVWGNRSDEGFTCLSFPKGIPLKILNNSHNHERPFTKKETEIVLFETDGQLTPAEIEELYEKPEALAPPA